MGLPLENCQPLTRSSGVLERGDFMHKLILRLLAGIGIVSSPMVAAQVSLPQVNLGATSFLDGVGGPGVLIQETPSYYVADVVSEREGQRV